MRHVGAWAACVGLAAALAGCNDLDYIRNGIGTNLRTDDLAVATQIQDAYVGEICRQAGLRTIEQALPDGTTAPACDELSMRSGDWALFVQAGMNDIDRRCDAYLAWLDDKRRSSEPILKEVAKLGAETIAILGAVNAGVKSITIVGIAFGLGADTFTNINDVLAGLNTSTIQSTVLGNQQEFRGKLLQNTNNKPVAIDNKPAAIYLLRSYLRICTPFSIGASINSTITVFHRAGPDALRDNPSLLTAPADLVGAPLTPSTPVAPPNRPPPKSNPVFASIIKNFDPRVHDDAFVARTLSKLCVPKEDRGSVDSGTVIQIRVYQQYVHRGDVNAQTKMVPGVTGVLTASELRDLSNRPACKDDTFRNFYEARQFPNGINTRDIIAFFNKALPQNQQLAATASADDVRKKIPTVRSFVLTKGLPLQLKGDGYADQLTWDLVNALFDL